MHTYSGQAVNQRFSGHKISTQVTTGFQIRTTFRKKTELHVIIGFGSDSREFRFCICLSYFDSHVISWSKIQCVAADSIICRLFKYKSSIKITGSIRFQQNISAVT